MCFKSVNKVLLAAFSTIISMSWEKVIPYCICIVLYILLFFECIIFIFILMALNSPPVILCQYQGMHREVRSVIYSNRTSISYEKELKAYTSSPIMWSRQNTQSRHHCQASNRICTMDEWMHIMQLFFHNRGFYANFFSMHLHYCKNKTYMYI